MRTIICLILGGLAIYYVEVIVNIIDVIQLRILKDKEMNRFNKDQLNVEDIYGLTPREFEMWSGDFLKKLGYKDIKYTELGPDGGKDIICKKFDEVVYVECKRYSNSKYATWLITEAIVKKLLGAMVHDDIKQGVIITTGNVTDEAIEFARTLDNTVSIRIINWQQIVETYNLGKPEFNSSCKAHEPNK